jgi:hypothetical protein
LLLRLIETDDFQMPQLHKHFNVVRNPAGRPNCQRFQMKSVTYLSLFILSTLTIYSQTTIQQDPIIIKTSEIIDISYSPKTLIASATYSLKTFSGQKQGIEFVLKTKPNDRLNIRIDSIILNTVDNKFLVLNTPYKDTVYYHDDGGLVLTTTHWLNSSQADFLKNEIVTTIIFPTDKQSIALSISKKSNRKLQVMARSQF